MREHVDNASPKDKPVFVSAFESAKVRISEAVGFTKACDLGWTPEWVREGKVQGYHALIGQNVAFRHSNSSAGAPTVGKAGEAVDAQAKAVGPTQHKKRGRVALPVLDKFKKFVLGLNPSVDDLIQFRTMLDQMIVLAKKG
jgi:hypothetical protein